MSRIQKKELRNKFINSRNLIKNKSLKENEIVNKLKNLLNLNKIPTSAYYSVNSEVNLNSFIRYMQSKDQRIVLPSINKINSYLVFKEWKENEKLIIDLLNSMREKITIIIITHKKSLLKNCDKIIKIGKSSLNYEKTEK